MDESGAKDFTLDLAQDYTSKSLTALDSFIASTGDKTYLEEIVKMLAGRKS